MEPEEEETEAKLTPSQIMEFFEACDTLLALPGAFGTFKSKRRALGMYFLCNSFCIPWCHTINNCTRQRN